MIKERQAQNQDRGDVEPGWWAGYQLGRGLQERALDEEKL